ncbi:enoyl-CoA hydratase-related protein [Bacillus spongiae]|uniref:Enoyl-CoA hydratase-related protein n=1 Tax=Bacillus spongiae TaxID=2683610 RepID=A0ABU8HHY0_9BACI
MTDFEYIQTKVEGELGFIELNRPHVLNAINQKMVIEILDCLERYDEEESVKVIVLTGNGRAFAAGADIEEMATVGAVDIELKNQFRSWDHIAEIKKPIIGAVQGFALGGGFELALCCDLLFAANNAEFGFPEVQLGIMPGAGGTQRLTKLIGKTRAMEWLLTGDRMSATEAERLGIINQTFMPELLLEETVRFTQKIAEQPSLSVRMIKEATLKAVDMSVAEGMKFERKNFSLLFSSEDQKEGMQAFMEKRKPNYRGR